MLSVLSPQSAINIQLAPNSLAAPAYLMPFVFHHKANSHFLINAVAFLWTLFICTFFFSCPEMPEGSSYLAQNSTDLSAAISPGSLYLISFCKSLSHLLLEFCFPGFSHRLLLIVFFSLRESGFLFFFGFELSLAVSFSQAISNMQHGEFGRCGRLYFGDFPSVGEST